MKDPRPKKMGLIKKKAFWLIQGAAKPIYFKAKGGLTYLTFPDILFKSNLAMLIEQEKFSDDMDPGREPPIA